MLLEIGQIMAWLRERFPDLRTEGSGLSFRFLDPVPEGTYVIPLGRTLTPTYVTVKDDRIHIGEDAAASEESIT
jgi:hypothetical protein